MKKNTLTILVLALLTLVHSSCATQLHRQLGKVREGMDKDEVLNIAGTPRRTYRAAGQDHWIYVFFKDDQEHQQTLSFAEGKLVRLGRAQTKLDWDKEVEVLKKGDQGFKNIDTESEKSEQPK